jgi:hypothetical protein
MDLNRNMIINFSEQALKGLQEANAEISEAGALIESVLMFENFKEMELWRVTNLNQSVKDFLKIGELNTSNSTQRKFTLEFLLNKDFHKIIFQKERIRDLYSKNKDVFDYSFQRVFRVKI